MTQTIVTEHTIDRIVDAASEFVGADHFYSAERLSALLDAAPRSLTLTHGKDGSISGYSLLFPLSQIATESFASGELSSGLEIAPEHLDEFSPKSFYVAMVQGFSPSAKASVLLDMSEALFAWMLDARLNESVLYARQGHPSSRAIMSTSGFTPVSSTSIGIAEVDVPQLSSFMESRRMMAELFSKRH